MARGKRGRARRQNSPRSSSQRTPTNPTPDNLIENSPASPPPNPASEIRKSTYAALVDPDEGDSLQYIPPVTINGKQYAHITPEDVAPEIEHWQTSVLCTVLGANPSIEVIERYVHKIWANYAIDKVCLVKSGLYLIRFTNMEDQLAVVNKGVFYFAQKPFVVKPWNPEMDLKVEEILHASGRVSTEEGVEVKEEEEEARRNQSLKTLLVNGSRDYVISGDGKQVPVSELEGKTVGLYFCVGSYKPCSDFTQKLKGIYNKLKEQGENFEVVLIYLDEDDEVGFNQVLAHMPWLAVPFKDKKIEKLPRYFELRSIPRLVIIGPDGKTLNPDVAELIEEHGIQAYPFTPEKVAELAEIEKARLESQTLESLLVAGEKDYVIDKTGSKVPVSELVGKHVLIYFSAHWCPPCRAFTPKLIEAYNKIKAKESAFEVIFVSSDRDRTSFDDYYSDMPWLALPFGDERKGFLSRRFKVMGIPCLVAIGPEGKTITTKARELIGAYGPDAFPFTEEHIQNLKDQLEETAKGWPEKLKLELHEHELVKSRRDGYFCDGCDKPGSNWSFYCKACDFDLHPECALKNDEKANGEDGRAEATGEEDKAERKDDEGMAGAKDDEDEAEVPEGYMCEGDVCRKV